MNYLQEIREFYRRMLLFPLNASAQSLWFALMYFANEAIWRMPISLREGEIRDKAGLSHKSFLKAREALCSGRYITHVTTAGNKPAKYYVHSLSELRGAETKGGASINESD